MSHGTNAELALRDLGIEIEKLQEDRDKWRNWAVDYAHDDETCECDRCDAVMRAYTGCTCRSQPNACPEHHDPTRD